MFAVYAQEVAFATGNKACALRKALEGEVLLTKDCEQRRCFNAVCIRCLRWGRLLEALPMGFELERVWNVRVWKGLQS